MAHRADRTSPAPDGTGSECASHSGIQRPQCSSGYRPAEVPHFRPSSLRGSPACGNNNKNHLRVHSHRIGILKNTCNSITAIVMLFYAVSNGFYFKLNQVLPMVCGYAMSMCAGDM